jgi:hypothetical protein
MYFSRWSQIFEASCQDRLNANSKALCEFNEVQWSDDWRNVKGSNSNLLSGLPTLGLKLPMSLQYLEW